MVDFIDKLVNKITMYKLILYYLLSLLALAMILSGIGILQYKIQDIAISALILSVACFSINKVLAYIFDAPTNAESSIITALILALIISPTLSQFNILFLLAASGLAMASKYLLAIKGKHIFNPAAVAVALTALGPRQSASWWVGTATLLPLVIIGGVLIARKIRRENMVITFFISTIIATIFFSVI